MAKKAVLSKLPMQSTQRYLALDEISPTVDAASYFKFEDSRLFRYRVLSHHFLLIESGHIEAHTPGGTFHGRVGDLLCFRPTDWNEYTFSKSTLFYQTSIRFAPPPKDRFTPSLGEFGALPIHISLGKAYDEMRRVFETFCIEIPQTGAVHLLRLHAAVLEMLSIIAGVPTRNRNADRHLDEWQRLRMRLDAELNADLPVSIMARRMNLSPSYFQRVFKQRFGITPKMYHTHARLQEAARLLRSTDKSVKTVAYELGFSNPKVFTRLFKSHLGVLPSDIRNGTARVEVIAPSTSGRLFPMNQHIVPPPQTPENWVRQCAAPPAQS